MLANVSGGVIGRSAWAIDHAFRIAFIATVRGHPAVYEVFKRFKKEPTQVASSTRIILYKPVVSMAARIYL